MLVNTVNCVGVMGKGLALEFKQRYPGMFLEYRKRCNAGMVRPGFLDVHLIKPPIPTSNWRRAILNFPTKRHWRDSSRLDDIQAGLQKLPSTVLNYGCNSIAIPPLGCGLGGLNWDDVRPLIIEAFDPYPAIEVQLYEPDAVIQQIEAEYQSYLDRRFCEVGY